MNKPDDIPQWAWEAAVNAVENSRMPSAAVNMVIIDDRVYAAECALAILRARQDALGDAAEVAWKFVHNRLYAVKFPVCSYHAREISDAIRSLSQPQKAEQE